MQNYFCINIWTEYFFWRNWNMVGNSTEFKLSQVYPIVSRLVWSYWLCQTTTVQWNMDKISSHDNSVNDDDTLSWPDWRIEKKKKKNSKGKDWLIFFFCFLFCIVFVFVFLFVSKFWSLTSHKPLYLNIWLYSSDYCDKIWMIYIAETLDGIQGLQNIAVTIVTGAHLNSVI